MVGGVFIRFQLVPNAKLNEEKYSAFLSDLKKWSLPPNNANFVVHFDDPVYAFCFQEDRYWLKLPTNLKTSTIFCELSGKLSRDAVDYLYPLLTKLSESQPGVFDFYFEHFDPFEDPMKQSHIPISRTTTPELFKKRNLSNLDYYKVNSYDG